mmetsp:Transcript_42364/g.165411  ORF Transcript_42364/g.165411 Transcript_42364/m.165411 type:complete len:94 (+) Transcript_42364:1687-1968(+)
MGLWSAAPFHAFRIESFFGFKQERAFQKYNTWNKRETAKRIARLKGGEGLDQPAPSIGTNDETYGGRSQTTSVVLPGVIPSSFQRVNSFVVCI